MRLNGQLRLASARRPSRGDDGGKVNIGRGCTGESAGRVNRSSLTAGRLAQTLEAGQGGAQPEDQGQPEHQTHTHRPILSGRSRVQEPMRRPPPLAGTAAGW